MIDNFKKFLPQCLVSTETEIPVVPLEGLISAGRNHLNVQQLNLKNCARNLKKAFEKKDAPFVGLLINSPGGSATQSHLIYKYIRQLAKQYQKKTIAFTEDVAASGGYMIACAADEIYADQTSIIGSIGVVSAMFGFQEAIKKLGIERRIYQAGKNKVTLDSFLPEKAEDREHLNHQLLEIHQLFIDLVKERRQEKLSEDETLFSGLFWTGVQAKASGLIDDWINLYQFVENNYGPKAKIKFITTPRPFFKNILGTQIDKNISQNLMDAGLATLKEEAYWARYGL